MSSDSNFPHPLYGQATTVCPVCGAILVPRASPDTESRDRRWHCIRAPHCLYTADDHNGKPLGRYDCRTCGRPLNLVQGGGRILWACSGFYQNIPCQQTYPDDDGEPDYASRV